MVKAYLTLHKKGEGSGSDNDDDEENDSANDDDETGQEHNDDIITEPEVDTDECELNIPKKDKKKRCVQDEYELNIPKKDKKKRCVRDMQDRPSGSVIQVEKEVKATEHRNFMSQCAQERECAPRMMSRDTIFYQILENKNSEMRLMQQNLKREMHEARLESDRQFYALQEQRLLAMAGYNSNFF